MKKYIKPVLYYENLQLAQHIATCAYDINSALYECTAVGDAESGLEGISIFQSDTGNCEWPSDMIEGLCATNGEAGFNIYNS